MSIDNKIQLHDLKIPALNSVGYGTGLHEVLTAIENNERLLANNDFVKGDKGDSVDIEKIKLSEHPEILNRLKSAIKGNEEPKSINNVSWDSLLNDELYVINKTIIENGIEKKVPISSLYYTFIDGRFVNDRVGNLSIDDFQDEIDLSCILVYNDGIFERLNNIFPTMYYENGKGLCWKVNGQNTGLPVQGVPGSDGKNSDILIVRVKDNSIDSNGKGEIDEVWSKDGGWETITNKSSLDGYSCFALAPKYEKDSNNNWVVGNATGFYIGSLLMENNKLFVICKPELSLQQTFGASFFVEAMQNISLLTNMDTVVTPKGLFVPMKTLGDVTQGESQPIHIISATAINNEEGNREELMTDMIMSPVNTHEPELDGEEHNIKVDKYLYVTLSDELYSAFSNIYSLDLGKDFPKDFPKDTILKYKLDNIVLTKNIEQPYIRIPGSVLQQEGAIGENGNIHTDKLVSVENVNKLIPDSFVNLIKSGVGFYKWSLNVINDDFDPVNTLHTGNEINIEYVSKYLGTLYTKSISPGIDDDVMFINSVIADDFVPEDFTPDTPETPSTFSMRAIQSTTVKCAVCGNEYNSAQVVCPNCGSDETVKDDNIGGNITVNFWACPVCEETNNNASNTCSRCSYPRDYDGGVITCSQCQAKNIESRSTCWNCQSSLNDDDSGESTDLYTWICPLCGHEHLYDPSEDSELKCEGCGYEYGVETVYQCGECHRYNYIPNTNGSSNGVYCWMCGKTVQDTTDLGYVIAGKLSYDGRIPKINGFGYLYDNGYTAGDFDIIDGHFSFVSAINPSTNNLTLSMSFPNSVYVLGDKYTVPNNDHANLEIRLIKVNNYDISGRVFSSTGLVLNNCTVVLKGSDGTITQTTKTDANGYFNIYVDSVNSDDVIEISYNGYNTTTLYLRNYTTDIDGIISIGNVTLKEMSKIKYVCDKCGNIVEEDKKPEYICPVCNSQNWLRLDTTTQISGSVKNYYGFGIPDTEIKFSSIPNNTDENVVYTTYTNEYGNYNAIFEVENPDDKQLKIQVTPKFINQYQPEEITLNNVPTSESFDFKLKTYITKVTFNCKDDNNNPISGVNIVIQDINESVTTNSNGFAEISNNYIPSFCDIIFSHKIYDNETKTLTPSDVVNGVKDIVVTLTTNKPRILRGVDFKSLKFNKFVPIYTNSYKVNRETSLNVNYNLNITGDTANSKKNLSVHGNVNCDGLNVYGVSSIGSINNIHTPNEIVGEKGITLADGNFNVDEKGINESKKVVSDYIDVNKHVSTSSFEVNEPFVDIYSNGESAISISHPELNRFRTSTGNNNNTLTEKDYFKKVSEEDIDVDINNVRFLNINSGYTPPKTDRTQSSDTNLRYKEDLKYIPSIISNVPYISKNANIIVTNGSVGYNQKTQNTFVGYINNPSTNNEIVIYQSKGELNTYNYNENDNNSYMLFNETNDGFKSELYAASELKAKNPIVDKIADGYDDYTDYIKNNYLYKFDVDTTGMDSFDTVSIDFKNTLLCYVNTYSKNSNNINQIIDYDNSFIQLDVYAILTKNKQYEYLYKCNYNCNYNDVNEYQYKWSHDKNIVDYDSIVGSTTFKGNCYEIHPHTIKINTFYDFNNSQWNINEFLRNSSQEGNSNKRAPLSDVYNPVTFYVVPTGEIHIKCSSNKDLIKSIGVLKLKPSPNRNISPSFEIGDTIYGKTDIFNNTDRNYTSNLLIYADKYYTDSPNYEKNRTVICEQGIIVDSVNKTCGFGIVNGFSDSVNYNYEPVILYRKHPYGWNYLKIENLLTNSIWETQLNG